MSYGARSMYLFSYYIFAIGMLFLFFPQMILWIAGFPAKADGLARLFGMLITFVSIYYFVASKHEAMKPFWIATVYTRISAFFIALLLVILGEVSWILIPVVAIEALAGIWTAISIRKDRLQQPLPNPHP